MKEIDPDLSDQWGTYWNGIKANNGCIYCMPDDVKYFLKIIPGEGQNAEIQVLEEQHLPRLDYEFDWKAGALTDDGCIYYLASDDEGHILKLDPDDGDSLLLVGEEIDEGCEAAVLGNDGDIYGISRGIIMKFNPIDHSISYVGGNFEGWHLWTGAVLAENVNIYAANKYGQIFIIDKAQNDWNVIENRIDDERYGFGWGIPALGVFSFLLSRSSA